MFYEEPARQGLLPLIAPPDMASHRVKHHLNRHPVPEWVPVPSAAWVHQQVYLKPYPRS